MAKRRSVPDLAHVAEALRPLAVPVGELEADPRNARRHDERNLAAIRASLARFGQRKPLVGRRVDGRLVLEAGHGTLEAARALGWSHVAVLEVDEAEAEAQAFALADNRTAELASWDDESLRASLALVESAGVPLLDLGWTPAEVRDLEPVPQGEDPGPGELPASTSSVLGEVYQLGPHRLLCGDSTRRETWNRLQEGEPLRMVWTDPPYGVRNDEKVAFLEQAGRAGLRRREAIEGDADTPEQVRG